jgi:hypothetical protein
VALYVISASIAGWFLGTRSSRRSRGFGRLPTERRLALALWATSVLVLISSLASAAPSHISPGRVATPGFDGKVMAQAPADHSDVLAAGFGFQAAGFSMITVRTYEAPSGAILSEDSFDVNVKEEGAAEHDGNRGRIFAGGIGTDPKGKSAFMLRVYDAETGRFLWEGQLNLLKVGEGGPTRASATIIPSGTSVQKVSVSSTTPLQILFSVRAVNPFTGGLVWQDQFAPGIRKRARIEGVLFDGLLVRPVGDPIGHIFDLVVRTYDRTSGTLLWEDSFEQLDRIEEPSTEPELRAYPQAIPSWNPSASLGRQAYQTKLR